MIKVKIHRLKINVLFFQQVVDIDKKNNGIRYDYRSRNWLEYETIKYK
ncbi:hypothetical protein [Litoribaculum gwangyangense]|uniref:KTSC domain-containing protein n=1 Tax=Litoribaculum gwangyangense TaxID=1130722 RepID=A0ABP9CR07_9FLAO